MTHHRTIGRRLATTAAVVVAISASAGPAWASGSGHQVRWTKHQLDQLASAYSQKNPGWAPPEASAAQTPAQKTWTPQALDRLAAAYSALNPGWTRP